MDLIKVAEQAFAAEMFIHQTQAIIAARDTLPLAQPAIAV